MNSLLDIGGMLVPFSVTWVPILNSQMAGRPQASQVAIEGVLLIPVEAETLICLLLQRCGYSVRTHIESACDAGGQNDPRHTSSTVSGALYPRNPPSVERVRGLVLWHLGLLRDGPKARSEQTKHGIGGFGGEMSAGTDVRRGACRDGQAFRSSLRATCRGAFRRGRECCETRCA